MAKIKPRRMADCHPDRPHEAKGLCHQCYQQSRYTKNPELRKIQQRKSREYYRSNPKRQQECKDRSRAYYYANKEHCDQQRRARYRGDPLSKKQKQTSDHERYIKSRAVYLKSASDRNVALRLKVIAHYGAKCVHCGFADPRALQLDHVNNDGASERGVAKKHNKRRPNGSRIYKAALEDTTGKYQLLCANCNWIKEIDRREADWVERIREYDAEAAKLKKTG